MKLSLIGCNFRRTPVELRERLAFDEPKVARALTELAARYGCEAVMLGTCNRVELYLARSDGSMVDVELVAEFLGECQQLPTNTLRPHLYSCVDLAAVRHLFRVAASLDSLVVGEAQIAGQVKRAYELAQKLGTAGPCLNSLFQHARVTAKRVRSETGLGRGNVSVSSVAVEYVKQVFSHFHDKTILVIGAGKMGELTLRHLRGLNPQRILVTNRSPEKAQSVAAGCGGFAVPFEQLDDALARADIVLSTTGASEPIVSKTRFDRVLARRGSGTVVILDIAVPRDFDPAIHDGDRAIVLNVDDLGRICDQTRAERIKHVGPAEAIVEQETRRFLSDWTRRRNGPVIKRLTEEFDKRRIEILDQLLGRLDGKLSPDDRKYLEGAFRLFQNRLLDGPIRTLAEAAQEDGGHTLLESLRRLFRLSD